MDPVLCDSVLISVEQVDLRMRGKIVLDQDHRELVRLAVIVTGNDNIRCFVIFSEQVILEMRIADHFGGELLPLRMVLRSDLLSQGFFMGVVPVIVSSDCHVRCTPL